MTHDRGDACPHCSGQHRQDMGDDGVTLTPQQEQAVTSIVTYVREQTNTGGHAARQPVFVLAGIAGSGKTTAARYAIKAIRDSIPGLRIGYLGSTHRARIQLGRSVAKELGRTPETYTVWRAAYRTGVRYFCTKTPKDEDGRRERVDELVRTTACEPCALRGHAVCGCRLYTRCSHAQHHLHCDVDEEPEALQARTEWPFDDDETVDLLWIDEGSMVTQEQLDILLSWEVPIVLAGDHCQLEPVWAGRGDIPDGQRMCHPMREPRLYPHAVLDEPQRQCPQSALYRVGRAVRDAQRLHPGKYDNWVSVLDATEETHVDVLLDVLSSERYEPGDRRVIITPWNTPRSLINQTMHHLWYSGDLPGAGERVTCRMTGQSGYILPASELIQERDLAAYWRRCAGVKRARRKIHKQITTLNRQITDILTRRNVNSELKLASGDHDRKDVSRLRDDIRMKRKEIDMFPASGERKTVKHGAARVVSLRIDPSDDGVVYLLLHLSEDHGDVPEGSRLVVRAAREQFGRATTMTKTERESLDLPALWDYGHCITTWAAQGGEWDDVIVLGGGWPAIYARCAYVAVTRARGRLVVCDSPDLTASRATAIASRLLKRALERE